MKIKIDYYLEFSYLCFMRTYEIKLNNNETPAKVNTETGEIFEFKSKRNNIPIGREVFEPNALFAKQYANTWIFLETMLTPVEYKIVHRMSLKAKMNTNSLEPLSKNSTIADLSREFNVHRNHIPKIFKKLFELGVYAEFKVFKYGEEVDVWILNPYISFRGKLISSDIVSLFDGTVIEVKFHKSIKD